jgi:hypothetical protein
MIFMVGGVGEAAGEVGGEDVDGACGEEIVYGWGMEENLNLAIIAT